MNKKNQATEIGAERRFVQNAVQTFVSWMPLGCSGIPLASFLLKQEWLMAGLLFPVTAISAVWASYSKNFVDRLAEISAARGKEDADALAAWLDSLNKALRWQFSGFDQKYLKLQAKLCQEYTTEGFIPDKTSIPMLEEVFVPLEVSGQDANPQIQERDTKGNQQERHIWECIRRSRQESSFRQMVIRQQGGFGKTTLLRHIALIYGLGKEKNRPYRAPKLIPFLLRLRDWRRVLSQAPNLPLPKLIEEFYLPTLSPTQPLEPPPKWAEHILQRGEALVMFDGFDELAEGQRKDVSHWISAQMNAYDQSTFILTSRPGGYKDYEAQQKPKQSLFIQKFNADQQERFIRRWYLCQERCARSKQQINLAKEAAERNADNLLAQLHDRDRPELQIMAANPLLLNMLATFHRFDVGVELPRRRVALYQGICKLQLEDRPKARGIPMLLEREKSQRILQELALQMVRENSPTVLQEQVLDFFKNHEILQQEEVAAEEFLEQMLQVSELLVERESKEYEFPHLSFQGYFAATQLHELNSTEVVLENWGKSAWQETTLLFSAQLPPKKFLEVIGLACKQGPKAAQLAAECLREYRKPEKLDLEAKLTLEQKIANLTGNVQTLLYRQLETYLKNGQWKEADNETYRLMITTVGKEEGQWFNNDELLNFPCEEMKKLDRLWVKYSEGRFGFSVQKKLYLECGGIPDGKYHEKSWEKLCLKNGWKDKNGNLMRNANFAIDAPLGHLPFGGWHSRGGTRLGVGISIVVFLFSRIETCKV